MFFGGYLAVFRKMLCAGWISGATLGFLPDLARDKSGRACLPSAGGFPRQPVRPDPIYDALVRGTTPLAQRLSAF